MRVYILALVFLWVPFFGACAPNYSTDTKTHMCEQTVLYYGKFRDNPDKAEEYANLFTADGSFHLGKVETQGRNALIDRHITAHKNAVWLHNMGDSTFKDNGGKLTAESKVIVMTGPDSENLNTRIEAKYVDEFEIVAGDCKIKSRKTEIISQTAN